MDKKKGKNIVRRRSLPKCEYCDVTKIDELINSINVSKKKKEQMMRFYKEINEKCKFKEYKTYVEPEYPIIVRKNTTLEDMTKCAEEIPVYKMTRTIYYDIKRRINEPKLQSEYNDFLQTLWVEIRQNYENITHGVEVTLRVKPLDGCDKHIHLGCYKHSALQFSPATRAHIQTHFLPNLFILQPIYRKLLRLCVNYLPNIIVDFTKFHDEPREIDALKESFDMAIQEGLVIIEEFSARVKHFIDKIQFVDLSSKSRKRKCLHGASGLLSVHVSLMLQNTIENLIFATGSDEFTPYLKFSVFYEDHLYIQPGAAQLISLYSNVLNKLIFLGKCVPQLDTYYYEGVEDRGISVFLTEDFLTKSMETIINNVTKMYEPVEDYVNAVEKDFFEIYQEWEREDSSEMTFEEGCTIIGHYRAYLLRISDKVSNEYFPLGQLRQEDCINSLKKTITKIMDDVLTQLINQHIYENESICEIFQNLSARCTEVPATSKALMEMGEYMLWANTVLLNELVERLENSLVVNAKLIEMTTISEEHMALNVATINWLNNIKPLLEQNASIYENSKYEFEENLAKAKVDLADAIDQLLPYLVLLDRMNYIDNIRNYMRHISPFLVSIKSFDAQLNWIHSEETVFKYPHSLYPLLDELKNYVYPFFHLLKLCFVWRRKYDVWMDGPFEALDFEAAEAKTDELYKDLQRSQKQYRVKIKQQIADGVERRFQGIVEDPEITNWPAPLKLCMEAIMEIKNFRPALSVMGIMRNEALLQRHWDDMTAIAGFDMTPNAGTTLRKIVTSGIDEQIDEFEIISSGATKEKQLLLALLKMQAEWDDIFFKTSTYKETGIQILTQLDDIQAVLDDHIVKTLTMRGSVFVKPYETQVLNWYEKIVRMNRSIDEWGKVQSTWLYLLPIFSSKDIVAQMPEEGVLFKEIDGIYKRYMGVVVKDPRVTETAGSVGLLESMIQCSEMMDQILDGVAAYLEKKRLYFPRFFFLSNDEMLEILSETKDPNRVQPHLKKCFEAVNTLDIDEKLVISAMNSEEGEKVKFLDVINTEDARGSVEKWLVQVEYEMKTAVKDEIFRSYKDYKKRPRTTWVQKWPGQIVLCVSQVFWTTSVHEALDEYQKKFTMTDFFNKLVVELQEIVSLIRNPTLTNLTRITIKALIVIDVHAKDVVEDLIRQKVQHENEFKWLAQLRYYWDEDCFVRIVNATVNYAYEYLGNSDRLVITPLTDRCYRTLIGAYHLHLNGAPEGPAGTGKTETTKDLAKAIAVQCVVFNCSDGLDYKAMGKFFKGLASSGAWVCFDEFNRIEIEVLSVVAQQILSIVMAVRANVETFLFEGTELKLNPTCYVCITMNPGYAGRSELPDNLKVLFRTVAMMVPDYALIGEISLYSYGFIDARNLSVKIVTVYRLCSEQLSSQNHYDYGMRAVKSVLSACGNNKRSFPDESEDILLLRSIIDVNLAKFLSHDVPLFEGIISDLFPGIVLPKPNYDDINKAILQSCNTRNLQPESCFILKIIQTYEMMIVRHGFMIVGDPFAGKSSTLKVLADSLTIMCELGLPQDRVVYQIINPKAITMGQLYGMFDPISYEWFDGVVANCFRDFVNNTSKDRKWIIFDGPVDAVWIENMNSVLDDNKKLCLMSGEVMSMTKEMSLIFEVMDLAQASPATVSRCGMIYTEPVNLGWRPFIRSWLPTCNRNWCTEELEVFVFDIFEWIVPPCLEFIAKNCRQLCKPGDISLVLTMAKLTDMYVNDACVKCEKKDDIPKNLVSWLQNALICAGIWGLGAILDTDSRAKFDEFYKNIWKGQNDDLPYPECLEKLEVPLPEYGLLTDFEFQYKLKGQWRYWPEIVKSMKVESAANIQQVLVPTVDSVRYMNLAEMHIRYKYPILFVGPTGTGKSFYLQDLLMKELDQDFFEPAFITFTVKISANQTQDLVISKLLKKKRGHYGPPKGKTCVIFIDDMNMPAKEIYGAQPPIELIRQYFDHKNWYDLKSTEPLYIYDTLFIGAMGLVGGSRQEIYARFLRHFCIYSINEFSDDSLTKIFNNVLLLGLKNNGFPSDVINSVHQMISATLEVYKQAMLNLRPTPAKSHYVFNLRDFARVVFGCSMLRKESGEDKRTFAKLWTHEILRIFYDRLIDTKDKEWVYQKIRSSIRDTFRDHFETVFENLERNEDGVVEREALDDIMFGNYLDQDAEENEKKYEELLDINDLFEVAVMCLDEYNSTHKSKMDIVLFKYALVHLSKICRVLAMPCGSALLVGVSGSGRQSLTRLASSMSGHVLFQPEVTAKYGMGEWRDDLKNVLKQSGGRAKHTVFLFTEDQIKEEGFLQDIDCLLNSGEVPNIFQIDERQEIMEMVRLAAQGGNRNLDISALAVFSFFIKRCREKLHIILCFSPIGSSLRTRLRFYPSFINCCTIDWFEDWPRDALEMVAFEWMADAEVSEDVKKSVVVACQRFHVAAREYSDRFFAETGRKSYITSASYIDLIKSFITLTERKQNETLLAKQRYVVGLDKLLFAAQQITEMQKNIAAFQPELKAMTQKAIEMTKQIAKESAEVERASAIVREDEKAANLVAKEAQALKAECEADLAEALPILEDALAALNTLKPNDITLVKSMKNPPDPIKLVMAAVCVMRGIKPDRLPDPSTGRMVLDFWGPSKRLLGDINFLQKLKDYDKDNIPPDIMSKIRKEYLPNKFFKPQIVAKASSAAEGLCKWIIAMDKYDAVAKIVAPKKAKLAAAEEAYAKTMAILAEKKEQIAKLEEKLAALNEALEIATQKQLELQDNVDLCTNKLSRAETLIGGLGGEKTRWTIAANNLQALYECLPGDILLSCAVISYLAPMTSAYRTSAITEWHDIVKTLNIPSSPEYNFTVVLGSEIKIQNWYINGLPRDSFSTENAIIMDNSRRWSLFVDPQNQANLWIKKLEKANDLKVTKFSFSDFMGTIQKCVEFGKPCLLENVGEELDVAIDPILLKSTFKQGALEMIALGDAVIMYSKNFRLYLTCKLRNPHYLPEVFNKTTIINFALTLEGLDDQLLGIVVAKERPDLQQKKEKLIVQNAENKAALQETENNILKTLSETKGDILEDESAIQVLDTSKALSIDIMKKQKVAIETEKKIEAFRMDYKPVAEHSAFLYDCIANLPNVDPMYQYSLAWFINLYINSIETANKSKHLKKRINFLKDAFTYNLYSNVTRSLFEKDKLMFSFLLCSKIMLAQEKINENEFQFFLTGGVGIENPIPNPAESWLVNKSWDEICRVDTLPSFVGFCQSFVQRMAEWKQYYDLTEPQNGKLPEQWRHLNDFQRLIVIRLLRPDKVLVSAKMYVDKQLGAQFTLPPPFNIAKSYEDSSCLSPLIFILSPGNDPMTALVKFAEVKGYKDKFSSISLGQGQGPIAKALIDEAQESGAWVCLQNCHLAVSWMPSLEKLWENMDTQNTHPSFRLWLTSYPSNKFPVSILQNGVKMTNEPPAGLQQNLLRSYTNEPVKNPDFYTGCKEKTEMFTRLLYGMAFFHAVVQERRTFGPLGWNIPYGFNESDFDISVQQLQMFINENENPYEAVQYLTGECNYGGRVTDDWDRRLIVTILDNFLNPSVVTVYNYTFSDAGPYYGLPKNYEYEAYIEHINNMPQLHPPEVCGLHKNAGITRDLQDSNLMLDAIILTQGEGHAGGSENTDQLLLMMASDIMHKLPKKFDIEMAKKKYPVEYTESMNTVLVQEMERFNKLLNEIYVTLDGVEKGVQGLVVMTPVLEVVANSLLLGRVPEPWHKVSYPSLKNLPNYVSDFVERLSFLQKWYERGKPSTYWLSGFFFTQAFLTGAKQNYARKYTIPIDKLTFDFEILGVDDTSQYPRDGVYIYGLFTDGARWDRPEHQLAELFPKVLNDRMPLIWIKPILVTDYDEGTRYKCPLYKTSERRGVLSTTGHSTNYVLPFLLETNLPTAHWIKRSVAMLCQLN